jgi:outer membrane protein TolC
VQVSFADYTNSRSILEMQTKNLAIAQQNYERAEQAYQSGLINNLTLREAQLSLINTENFIENAKFAAKMYEYQLLQSAGMLMQ